MADQEPVTTEKNKTKKIAVLGWGSLIWDTNANRAFDHLHGKWMHDGPVLNLQFSRKSKSRAGALTLVIDAKHGTPCTVAYALSTRSKLAEAIKDLSVREGSPAERIGRFVADDSPAAPDQSDAAAAAISAWAEAKGFDIVLWTALAGSFDAVPETAFIETAVTYLQNLTAEGKAKAAEYLWRAPGFVQTPLRKALQKKPWFAPPKQPL